MRLDQNFIVATQELLENVGYCRFSAFYSATNKERGVLIEMVGRAVVGLFAALSLYDLATRSLPFAVKVLVHGTLITIVSSLGLSLLLKKLLPAREEPPIAKKVEVRIDVPADQLAPLPAVKETKKVEEPVKQMAEEPSEKQSKSEPAVKKENKVSQPKRPKSEGRSIAYTPTIGRTSPDDKLEEEEEVQPLPREKVRRNLLAEFERQAKLEEAERKAELEETEKDE